MSIFLIQIIVSNARFERTAALRLRDRRSNMASKVRKCFTYGSLDGLRTSFHLAHQHSALNRSDTEISKLILASVCRQPSLCLFPDEKGSELIFHKFKKDG